MSMMQKIAEPLPPNISFPYLVMSCKVEPDLFCFLVPYVLAQEEGICPVYAGSIQKSTALFRIRVTKFARDKLKSSK